MEVNHNLITTIADLKLWVARRKQNRQSIGVVPTMGALHAGHLSLVAASLDKADATIVTIFVNPTQFSASEDLSKYPRTLEEDIAALVAMGQVTIFAPRPDEIYPAGFSTTVVPPTISKTLEGEKRPSHFAGVATVVLKLLNMTGADFAFFGQKDFQQQLVVTRMAADLNVATEIVVCPIVREPDGLAMSSRNVYLSPAERQTALIIHKTLDFAEDQIQTGQTDSFQLIAEMRQMLIDGGVDSIDYAVVANPDDLQTPDPIELPIAVLIASYVGKTRLIDNRIVRKV